MTNRNADLPRNLRFQQNSLRTFVQGSSFLNATGPIYKQNISSENKINNTNMMLTHSNFQNKTMGFDSYNKNNLLLRACNAEDIQYVQKNPVVYQEDIIPQYPKTTKTIPAQKSFAQQKSKTTQNFYVQENSQKQIKKSNQAELNDFLFNYKKQEEEKKNKKLKFLQEVEKRINNLQKQTEELQQQKQVQYKQLNGILQIHNKATQNARKAELVGKISMALHQSQEMPRERLSPPKKITEDMKQLQINMAIQQQHEYNDALLDQIQRVSRSKSRNKGKNVVQSEWSPKKTGVKKQGDKLQEQQSSLSKTLKRPMQIPPRPSNSKKMTSTWRGK